MTQTSNALTYSTSIKALLHTLPLLVLLPLPLASQVQTQARAPAFSAASDESQGLSTNALVKPS